LLLALAVNAFAADIPPEERWWSLRPLVRPALPASTPGTPSEHPVDFFVQAKLREQGLAPSPEAGRRTLLRRLSFDLTGLPPSTAEVERFLNDSSPSAYERLVDRLLDSPAYGERWARHWLDVVHYGDTHGYDKDKLRENAWPYRDYVIRAFNADKPYARFVQEQLAGDVFFPNDPDAFEALGFISAGPWDFIGHAEVPETKIDGRIARHLDRDDMVANTLNTFNSLTVQCAQCHYHKFDPISSEDYYSLQAVFAAVDRADQEYDRDPAVNARRRELRQEERSLESARKSIEADIQKAGGATLAELKKAAEPAPEKKNRPAAYGYHSAVASQPDAEKWVQLDFGAPVALEKILLAPCSDDFAGIGEGFGFPARSKIELSNHPEFREGVTRVADRTSADLPNPKLAAQVFEFPATPARYLRVTATKLAPRQNDFIFALAELQAFGPAGTNLARQATVTALDSIESPERWAKANLVDGLFPGASESTSPADKARRQQEYLAAYERLVLPPTRTAWHDATNRLAEVRRQLAALPTPNRAFVGAIHHGSGPFRGTGPDGGKPRPIFVLNRGDVRKPGAEAQPGALSCLPELPARFDLPAESGEGARRAALARWITARDNPLTWRSIVNRVWQYHFGRGLVDTPNDFGRMGALPTHPELLDWLAVEFRDGGQSFKKLHRLLVTSRTYRQVSAIGAEQAEATLRDVDNRWLWRMNRRKLEAEAVRDSVLWVSGRLDPSMYGPGFRDFVIDKPEHSPHYEYHLHDPNDPKTHRRSIYRFIVRSQQQPFMTVLDCADPSMLVEKRNQSLSPLQALALLNNGFMLTMAHAFAQRLESEAPDLPARVDRAVQLAFAREPSPAERDGLIEYARAHGLANMSRLLFNLNEFLFVD